MRMAVRLARLIMEGTKMNWLVTRLAKIKGLGILMTYLNNGEEGLGVCHSAGPVRSEAK